MFWPILIKGLTLSGLYFLVSFGITLLYGVGGFPNLAIGPIGLAGAYVTVTVLRAGGHVSVAIILGIFCAITLGVVVQKLVVEPLYNSVGGGEKGRIYVIYGTFGLCLVLPAVLLNVFESTMVSMRFPSLGIYRIADVSITGFQALSFSLALLFFFCTHVAFTRTRHGNCVRAVTQNPKLSALIGINVKRMYLIISVLASGSAYTGAVLWGEVFFLELGSGLLFTLYGFIIAVMGGLGSIYGAFIVSLILGLTLSASSFLIGGVWEFILTTILLIVVLLIWPRGIVPTKREV